MGNSEGDRNEVKWNIPIGMVEFHNWILGITYIWFLLFIAIKETMMHLDVCCALMLLAAAAAAAEGFC